MDNYSIYKDISRRTQGDIYLGVVGPVRTGKSTFIKRFMEMLVLPSIDNDFKRKRAMDELPQSAGGRTIMTTEPKFIPNEAVEIEPAAGTRFKVRMIDCVGYIVDGAQGYIEDNMPRMVMTPWSNEPIPFTEAAEMGTHKVIDEHSTVGIVVTTDGSITDIARDEYKDAEARVIRELQKINKPFVVVVNTTDPHGESARRTCCEINETYGAVALPIDCMRLNEDDIGAIMQSLLYEFPIKEARIIIPSWVSALSSSHPLKEQLKSAIFDATEGLARLSDAQKCVDSISACESVEGVKVDRLDAGDGTARIRIDVPEELFYDTVREVSGFDIHDKQSLVRLLDELSDVKKKYDKISAALTEVNRKGYGIVSPSIEELTLEEPEIVKQGSRFGVRLRASAPSIHMIRADIETEVSPIVGTEKQSEELVHYLMNEFETDPKQIWESNIFGKSLHELVNEGLHNKLYRMPDDAQMKLQETLQKIINEGSGGLICIIL